MSQELDLAFCCDCTGSMSSYLRSAQDNILNISQKIHEQAKASVRYGLVKYRDHPPQDKTFVTETFPFTPDIEIMKNNVNTMKAAGGGDGPESVCCGLHEVLHLDWRPNSTKVCVLISDAPPHGLGEEGDGFANGCPDGRDPLKICREMAERGVVVYAVAVEPILSTSYKFARDFMMAIARLTEGKFLPLGKADILAQVIVSGALEGLNLDGVWAEMEKQVAEEAAKKGEALKMEDMVARTHAKVAESRATHATEHVEVSNPYMDDRYDHFNDDLLCQATSMAQVSAQLDARRNSHVQREVHSYAWGAQEAKCVSHAPMSEEQVMRCQTKQAKAKGFFSWNK
eukprot:PhF_6_TR37668/c1_g1_i1/m.56057